MTRTADTSSRAGSAGGHSPVTTVRTADDSGAEPTGALPAAGTAVRPPHTGRGDGSGRRAMEGPGTTITVGTIVVDTSRCKVGTVHAVYGDRLSLVRPGGTAWDVRAGDARPATAVEALSVKVAVANGRWGR